MADDIPDDVPDWIVCPDCGPVVVEPDVFSGGVGISGECPKCCGRLYFEDPRDDEP